MSKITGFLFLLLLRSNGFGQTVNCENFRNGEFYYPSLENKLSIRKDSIQNSYNDGIHEMQWKINWLDDCSYRMECEKVFADNVMSQVGDVLIVTILSTEDDCFTFSIMVYTKETPDGFFIPSGTMCKRTEQ